MVERFAAAGGTLAVVGMDECGSRGMVQSTSVDEKEGSGLEKEQEHTLDLTNTERVGQMDYAGRWEVGMKQR